MKYILINLLFLLLFSSMAVAQNDGQWTHYPLQDDMLLENVTELDTDENNVLWAATYRGIHRYDGSSWIFYSNEDIGTLLPCESMVFDADGTLHLITQGYRCFLEDTWIDHSENIPYEFDPKVVDVATNGDVWFGGYGGLLHFNGSSWYHYRIHNRLYLATIKSIAVDHSGDVWCSTNLNELFRFDGQKWIQYTEDQGLGGIYDILISVSPDRTIWCGGVNLENSNSSGWLARYEGNNTWQVVEGNPFDHDVDLLEVDSTGVVWLSDRSYRFASFDGIDWKEYSLPDWHHMITSLTVDNNGVVWIGTWENGIYRFDPNPTAVGETAQSPMPLSISENYPNPFNPSTTISYSLAADGHVSLSVYNLSGQKVATLVDSPITAGTHQAVFDGSNLANGMYFYRFEAGNYIRNGKMMLVK